MKDKVVVITGASAGIGAALAEVVAERGGRPVLVARRQAELQEVANRCGTDALVVVADVTHRADVERAREAALARWGGIDVWVNNAGRGMSRPVLDLTDEDLDEMMTVNVKSALYGMQAIVPHFKTRGRGHVINVSSVLSRVPFATVRAGYSASKHALNALTACLRVDLRAAHPHIAVTNVLPGVVATEFGVRSRHGGLDSRTYPGAQPAYEVAEVIADVMAKPRAEIYTRPTYKALVTSYFAAEDLAEIETKPPFVPGRTITGA